VIQLTRLVPVELRYETIVFEDGQLHIYRDVYIRTQTRKKTCGQSSKSMALVWTI